MSFWHHDPEIEIIILEDDKDEIKLLKAMLRELREIRRELKPHHHFTIRILGVPMAINAGSTGTFTAELEDNGIAIPLPAGSTFAWSADDTNAVLTPATDSLSVVVTVPASDTATSITVTAATTAPDGSTVSGSVTVPITPGVTHTFTVLVSQTA